MRLSGSSSFFISSVVEFHVGFTGLWTVRFGTLVLSVSGLGLEVWVPMV